MNSLFNSFSLISLSIIFLLSSGVVWIAGVKLTRITDNLDYQFNLGQALGGVILLAIVTNLPEIAIVIGASLTNNIGIATGNILGGVAIQTVVLVLLDGLGLKNRGVLTRKPMTLQLVVEGVLVIIVLLVTIMGAQLPKSFIFFRIAPGDVAIAISWIIGLWLIKKSGSYLPWRKRFKVNIQKKKSLKIETKNTFLNFMFFLGLAIVTLIAGLLLEESSSAIAVKIGWNGVLFGATILAAVTALPEISTGLTAVKIKDYTLAISDIFGGNAFLPVLFLLATLITGTSTLPSIQKTDIYLASLSALLTAVYIYGLIFSSKRQFLWLGIDSIVVLIIYLIGIIGLFFMSGK